MSSGGLPVIRLTLEGFQLSILAALTEREAAIDADIKAAVEAYLTPENVKAVIQHEVSIALERAVRDEVEQFYRVGAGRRLVRESIRHALLSDEEYERQYGKD